MHTYARKKKKKKKKKWKKKKKKRDGRLTVNTGTYFIWPNWTDFINYKYKRIFLLGGRIE